MLESQTKLALPRGTPGASPLVLDMTDIYKAEQRLADIRVATPANCVELMGTFNQAAHLATNYKAWTEYELLMAKQQFDKRKAILMLDEMPEVLERLKEKGIKGNDDVREAIIVKDVECFQYRDRIDCLNAALSLLDGKIKSFVRAYNAAKIIAESRRHTSTAYPQVGGSLNNDNEEY